MVKTDKFKSKTQTPSLTNGDTKKKLTVSSDPGTTDPALMEFFKGELKDIYWAENHLVEVLPKMIKAATTDTLAKAISSHLKETLAHVSRIERVFDLLGEKHQAKKCDAMEGITKEGDGILEETEAGTSTRDVGIIMASKKVEHYEIATYSGLIQLANVLGLSEAVDLLSQTLLEEKRSDENLTAISVNDINYRASAE